MNGEESTQAASLSQAAQVASQQAMLQQVFDIFQEVKGPDNKLNDQELIRALEIINFPLPPDGVKEIIKIMNDSAQDGAALLPPLPTTPPTTTTTTTTSVDVSPSTAAALLADDHDISSPPLSITFAQFYSVVACIHFYKRFSHTDFDHLRVMDVRDALLEAGLDSGKTHVESMFQFGDLYRTRDRMGPIRFGDLLRIYVRTPSQSASHVVLHSWYSAGRNSTPYNKPVEISPIQDMIAGTAAGVALTLVGHPFDTIKVRLQTSTHFKSGMDCLWQTVSKESVFALFKGMAPPLVTIPAVNALVFFAYAQGKEFFHSLQEEQKPLNLLQISACGAYAGVVNCVVCCPLELVKIRLQTQYDTDRGMDTAKKNLFGHDLTSEGVYEKNTPPARRFTGPWDCVKRIVEVRGIKGLYRGMSATVYREIPGYGGQFFLYEAMKSAMCKPGEKSSELSASKLVLAGGTAGTFGWLLSYPIDYVKSVIQAERYDLKTPWKKNKYLLDGGFFDCWSTTVRRFGFKELWRGFGTCAARAFPANGAGFLAYELSLKTIKAIDTNSTR